MQANDPAVWAALVARYDKTGAGGLEPADFLRLVADLLAHEGMSDPPDKVMRMIVSNPALTGLERLPASVLYDMYSANAFLNLSSALHAAYQAVATGTAAAAPLLSQTATSANAEDEPQQQLLFLSDVANHEAAWRKLASMVAASVPAASQWRRTCRSARDAVDDMATKLVPGASSPPAALAVTALIDEVILYARAAEGDV